MNGGFKERAARNGTPTYVYDANGNLTQDKNKGLTITYNYLNLPQTITFDGTQGNAGGTIDFTYDATGKKWRKTVTPTRQCGQVRDYIDGVEYTSTLCGLILSSPTPDIIHFSDGYIQRDPSTDGNYSWLGWVYKYALTDHLGNTRVVFSDKNDDGIVGVTDIEQINNYYPFGLNMDGPWNGASGQYKFQYNQKEWNSDLGLNLNDYGARFYDPTIGRWNGVDALSEKYFRHSPYNYGLNNPIRFIDPDGNAPDDHFFDNKGNYLGSTETGNDIRVVNAGATFQQATENPNSNSKLLTEVDLSVSENKETVSNVATYYGKQVGLDSQIGVNSTTNDGALAFTEISTGKVSIAVFQGKINPDANDANNLMNSIFHEKEHVLNPSTVQPFEHAQIGVKQMQHSSFDGTTANFKASIPAYSMTLLNQAINKGVSLEKIQGVIDAVNKFSSKTRTDLFLGDDGKVDRVLSIPEVKISGKKN